MQLWRHHLGVSGVWYPLALKVGGRTVFLLWVSDDWALNRVLASVGQVAWFTDEDSARQYALTQHLALAQKEELTSTTSTAPPAGWKPMARRTAACSLPSGTWRATSREASARRSRIVAVRSTTSTTSCSWAATCRR